MPYTLTDVEEFFRLYGDQAHLLTEKHEDGTLAAFALLTPPMRLLGRTPCQLLAAGTDGTVPAKVLFQKVLAFARSLGADSVMASTYRHAPALARMFGGTVDSVNIRWDLS